LCFDFWKNYRATEPFPGIGFQTTNERRSPDDLPRSEVKQSNPITPDYRPNRAKHNRSFPGNRRLFSLDLSEAWRIIADNVSKVGWSWAVFQRLLPSAFVDLFERSQALCFPLSRMMRHGYSL
jgi:hypothetical protein